ncbi:hypothetical protein [Aliiglaciecola sp. NS0011-25]|uniref:hypothetical protein n=1 Tax=Aliiglaciecola sp. NS0011-25 TaxID=3127654 RepID=UPI003341CE6D
MMWEFTKTLVVLTCLTLCACSSPYTVITTEQVIDKDDEVMLLKGYKTAYLIASAENALNDFSGTNSRYIDNSTTLEIVKNEGVTIFDAPLNITEVRDCYKIDYAPSSNSNQNSGKDETYFIKISKSSVANLYILNLLESCTLNDMQMDKFTYMPVILENNIATFFTFSDKELKKLTWDWYNDLNFVKRYWLGVSENDSNDEDEKKSMPIIFENARGLVAVMEYVYYHKHSSTPVRVQLGESTDEQRALFNQYSRATARKAANQ